MLASTAWKRWIERGHCTLRRVMMMKYCTCTTTTCRGSTQGQGRGQAWHCKTRGMHPALKAAVRRGSAGGCVRVRPGQQALVVGYARLGSVPELQA